MKKLMTIALMLCSIVTFSQRLSLNGKYPIKVQGEVLTGAQIDNLHRMATDTVRGSSIYVLQSQIDSYIANYMAEHPQSGGSGNGIYNADSAYFSNDHILAVQKDNKWFYYSPDDSLGITDAYCIEYRAIYNAMTSKPTIYDAAQNTLVSSAKTHGWWSVADGVFILAQENNGDGESLINWIVPSNKMTNTNNLAFTADEGITGDGTNTLGTGIVPGSVTNATLNSTTIAVYCRLIRDEYSQVIFLNSGSQTRLIPANSGNLNGMVNTNASASFGITNSQGLSCIVRRGATETEFYKNGVSLGTDATTSTSLPDGAYTLLNSSTNQLAFAYFGGALTDQQVADMNTDVETYMDAIGKGVE